MFKDYKSEKEKEKSRILKQPSFDPNCSVGYFDGAQKDGICGAGMVLNIKRGHSIRFKMGVGYGNNTQAVNCFMGFALDCQKERSTIFAGSRGLVGDNKLDFW